LALRYDAHINVEVCGSIKSVKYLYKYVYKGPDRAMAQLASATGDAGAPKVRDEVSEFQDLRSVGASEACWRILGFPMSDRNPAVVSLPVHLDGEHRVYFKEGREQQAVDREPATALLSWLEYNRTMAGEDPNCLGLLYPDFPRHYTLDPSTKKWKPRKQGAVIGRMFTVSPLAGEAYYLRMLLTHVRGATSYEDIRTVNGEAHPTFKAACAARGLLADDSEWESALREAASAAPPSELRALFVSILVFCNPTDPAGMFRKWVVEMGEDYQRAARGRELAAPLSEQTIEAGVLLDIRVRLLRHGVSLRKAGLVEPGADDVAAFTAAFEAEQTAPHHSPDLQDELRYDREACKTRAETSAGQMNEEQSAILAAVRDALRGGRKDPIYVQAPGGTGKTWTCNTILDEIRGAGNVALAVASSGIAATLLDGGRTFHSRFKMPILHDANSVCNISAGSGLAELIAQARVIIWDEAPIAHRHNLEALDRTLRDIMREPGLPFGGKLIILTGDFCQTLPVLKHGNRAQVVGASIKKSPLWDYFRVFRLTTNMRIQSEGTSASSIAYAKWILQLGTGTADTREDGLVAVSPDMCLPSEDLPGLIRWAFPKLSTDAQAGEDMGLGDASIIAPTNVEVDEVNEAALKVFPGGEQVFTSADTVTEDSEMEVATEHLNGLVTAALPPHELRLKLGVPLLLLRNIDPAGGLCNGTRLLFTQMHGVSIMEAVIATGRYKGKRVFIPRMALYPTEGDFPFNWCRRQFPVKLAFATTINKSQGQTLGRVVVLLRQQVFGHGQLYVAASRVRGPQHIRFALPTSARYGARNVVYHEALV
jgi:hypothetical protein